MSDPGATDSTRRRTCVAREALPRETLRRCHVRPSRTVNRTMDDTELRARLAALSRAERLAYLAHDLFGVAFEDVARTVGRSPAVLRRLAGRARRRMYGADDDPCPVVETFLRAVRAGDYTGLLACLDPDVVLRSDTAAPLLRGAAGVAEALLGYVPRVVAAATRSSRGPGDPTCTWSA